MEKAHFCAVNVEDDNNINTDKFVSVASDKQFYNSLSCPECNIKFDSVKSLNVHTEYHRDTLLSKWTINNNAYLIYPLFFFLASNCDFSYFLSV